jgi:hypothetical protein
MGVVVPKPVTISTVSEFAIGNTPRAVAFE